MSATHNDTIIFIGKTEGEFAEIMDPVNDFPFGDYFATWRREGQVVSAGLMPVVFFTSKEAQDHEVVKTAEKLLDRISELLPQSTDAVRIVEKLNAGIRLAIATGLGWNYVHSRQYNQIVADAKAEAEAKAMAEAEAAERNKPEPLAAWEEEILNRLDKTSA